MGGVHYNASAKQNKGVQELFLDLSKSKCKQHTPLKLVRFLLQEYSTLELIYLHKEAVCQKLIRLKAIEEGTLLLRMMGEQLRVVIVGVGVEGGAASSECVIIIFIRGIPSLHA